MGSFCLSHSSPKDMASSTLPHPRTGNRTVFPGGAYSVLYDNFNAIGWEPCQTGSGVGLVDTGGMKDRHGVLAVCQGLGKQCCHPYWREKRVCLLMATHGGGGGGQGQTGFQLWFWAPLVLPPACSCRWIRCFPPLNPASGQENVASCDSFGYGRCSWSILGEARRGTRSWGGGWALLFGFEFFHSPRQKLSNLRSEGNSAKLRQKGFFPQNLCWQPETDVDLGGRESPLWATIKERLKGQAPRGRWSKSPSSWELWGLGSSLAYPLCHCVGTHGGTSHCASVSSSQVGPSSPPSPLCPG